MKKKLIAAVTSVAMVATMVPATALAASSQPAAKAKTQAAAPKAAETPAEKVTRLIDAIGTVENTAASNEKIKAAEAAYGALSDYDQQSYNNANAAKVTLLKDSRKAYDKYAGVLSAAQAAIDKVPDKLVTEDFAKFVTPAKTAYDAFNTRKTTGGSEGTAKYSAGGDAYKLDDARKAKYDAVQDATLKAAVEAVDKVVVSDYTDADYDNADSPAAWKKAKEAIAALTNASLETRIKNLSRVDAIDQAKAQDKAAVDKVNSLLSALTNTVNKDNAAAQQKAYDEAKAAYDKLSDTLQGKIASENTDKMDALKTALKNYNDGVESEASATAKAAPVIEKIKRLPEDRKIELTDEAAVKDARTAYDALDPAAKKKVDDAKVSGNITADVWLENAEYAIEALLGKLPAADRAQRTMNLIKAIPTPASAVTRDDAQAVAAAKADYDAINSIDTQKLVTNLENLTAALEQIDRLTAADKTAAAAVIAKYPNSAMTVSSDADLTKARTAVTTAESAYNNAGKWVQYEVDNAYDTQRGYLKDTKTNIANYEKGLSDKAAANVILSQMKALPAADKITSLTLAQYKDQVRAAESAYTTAAAEVKAIVKADAATMAYYQAAVNKVNTLEASAKVPELVKAIDALKVLKADGTETEAAINNAVKANKAARDNYNALPTVQKADVTNLDKLEAAEKSEIPAQQKLISNEAKKIGITTSNLTDAQIAAINETTRLIEEYFAGNVDKAFDGSPTEKGDYTTAKATLDKQIKDKTDAEAAPIIAAANAIASMKIDKTNADYVVKIYNDYQKLSAGAKAKVDATDVSNITPAIKANKFIEKAFSEAKVLVLDLAKIDAIADQSYTGTEIIPTVVVKDAAGTIIPSSQYNTYVKENVDAGTATVTILPAVNSNYTGSTKTTFTIKAAAISEASVSGASDATYTGKAIKPSVKVTVLGRTLVNNTDYTVSYGSNLNKGTGTVTITGKGNYTGTKTIKFNIKAKSVSGASVSGATTTRTYTGKQIKPSVKVVVSGKTLKNGTDYAVSYGSNKSVGKGSVKITAKGNYTGTISKSFRISPAKESITSLKSGKGKFTVKFKKQTGASYQIYYKASGVKAKTYKTSSTTKTISKLKKGKTYSVKVRAYKKIDGKTYYGSYSAAKKVKVKK